MQLHEDGERAVTRAVQEVHLPGRQPPPERPLHELTGEPAGLRHEVPLGEDDPLDVPVHVEVLVREPGGAAHGEQDVAHPHPQPGDGGGAGPEQFEQLLRGHAGHGVEDGERAEVHRVGIGFEVPESQIKRCQKLGTQRGLASSTTERRDRSQSRKLGYGQVWTCYVLLQSRGVPSGALPVLRDEELAPDALAVAAGLHPPDVGQSVDEHEPAARHPRLPRLPAAG